MPSISKGPDFGLELFTHKKESKKVVEDDTPMFVLGNLDGEEPHNL